MIYLELDEVLAIASEVLALEVDALIRVTDLGLADSAVARPFASFGGEEFYPSIESKAASLLFGLARNHAFIDGNKRVAVLATLQFLNTNGLDLDLSPPEEAFNTVVQVASGTLTLDALTDWIRDRTGPLERSEGNPPAGKKKTVADQHRDTRTELEKLNPEVLSTIEQVREHAKLRRDSPLVGLEVGMPTAVSHFL
ncbi:MAG: type II toxin-antitoxin system death-on-curing family toxin [bacterium]|nr:type II toxin-antitoxin system death-on-curing family toxin [bacterium]MDE0439410.1 type II toxin-antitoxin system death-on-curing family toxin [bacterium]